MWRAQSSASRIGCSQNRRSQICFSPGRLTGASAPTESWRLIDRQRIERSWSLNSAHPAEYTPSRSTDIGIEAPARAWPEFLESSLRDCPTARPSEAAAADGHAAAGRAGRDDARLTVGPLLERIPDRAAFIGAEDDDQSNELPRSHSRTGRVRGFDTSVESLERCLARTSKRTKPGPKTQACDRDTGDLLVNGGGIE